MQSVGVFVLLALALAASAERTYYKSDYLEKEIAVINVAGNALMSADNYQASGPLLGATFPCTVATSPSTPTSVHQLRPSDIKVVGAVGDSITAALGAKSWTLLDLTTEARGVSWSIGGDADFSSVQTLPNVIRKFNPSLTGYSQGKCSATDAAAGLNVAITGATAQDLPGQADDLIAKIKANSAINWNEDWKVITLWIGANDQCRWCKENAPAHFPENYQLYIEQALDKLITIPRVFINLVNIIDVNKLNDVTFNLCPLFHDIACECLDKDAAGTAAHAAAYQAAIANINANPKYKSDTFTVELQPFFINTAVPDGERSYLAPDCFHFAQKSHAAAGVALWNNMLEAPGQKQTSWNVGEGIRCPTEVQPFLCTSSNNCGSSSKAKLSATHAFLPQTEQPAKSSSVSATTTVLVAVGSCVGVIAAVVVAIVVYRRRQRSEYAPILG